MSLRTHSKRLFAVSVACVLFLSAAGTADGHPVFGEQWKLRQPDGALVDVKIWGDEFYQVVESLDGHTLVRDPVTSVICYAKLSHDGNGLESTGVPVGTRDPVTLGLEPHIRISHEARRAAVAKARAELARQRDVSLANRGITLETVVPPITGNVVGLCLLADFSDQVATIPRDDVVDYCNQVGYTGYGNNGSVRDYYFDCSNGNLTYTNWVADGYYRAAQPFTWYDDPNVTWLSRGVDLIIEILNDMEAKGFDFSQYDANGDGYIDAINLFYAGLTTAGWAKGMWPGSGWIQDMWGADGVKTLRFQVSGMGAGLSIATYCHENGHMLGFWPDLYDYDGDSGGIGQFCLMSDAASGTNPVEPCAYLKYIAGWGNVTTLSSRQFGIPVPVSSTNTIFKCNNPLLPNEYFLLENRQRTGRDAAMPDDGLAIWHVDENGDHSANEMLPDQHFLVTLVQADGDWDLENNRNLGDATDLWSAPGYTACTPCTDPNTDWWNGGSSGLMFTNIGPSASTMAFDFSPLDEPPVASCKNYSADADESCCVTVNLSDVDDGSYDPNGLGDIASLCITAVDGSDVGCSQQVELCGDGMHTVTMTITDLCGDSDHCDANVEVVNSPPVAACKAFSDTADDECGIAVELGDVDGGSYDPDGSGDISSFCITAVDGNDVGCRDDVDVYGQGSHTVTITMTDWCGYTSSCDAAVEVIDDTPPEIEVVLNRDVLWPPNHKMVDIAATVTVTDNCCAAPTFRLTSITSDEEDNGKGDGNTTGDIQGADYGTADTSFQLRSERTGKGEGRLYTVVYTAEDCVGNTEDDTVYVRVPHDQSGWALASEGFADDGLGLDPTQDRFALIIASRAVEYSIDGSANEALTSDALDATALDPARTYVGNAKDVALPIETVEVDNDGDGFMDLVLYYSTPAVKAIIEGPTSAAGVHGNKNDPCGPIGLHYVSASGVDYLVADIFTLGDPVPLAQADAQKRRESSDESGPLAQDTPAFVELRPAYPNPFSLSTTISFTLTAERHVTLEVYDARGQLVATLKNHIMPPGLHRVVWNGRDKDGLKVATGVYFVQLRAGRYASSEKVIMLQ